MTRGNQRELARQKNQKKNSEKKKDDGLTLAQRKERDRLAMEEKIKKKEQANK